MRKATIPTIEDIKTFYEKMCTEHPESVEGTHASVNMRNLYALIVFMNDLSWMKARSNINSIEKLHLGLTQRQRFIDVGGDVYFDEDKEKSLDMLINTTVIEETIMYCRRLAAGYISVLKARYGSSRWLQTRTSGSAAN